MTGARLFVRYAYPPNALGYCGPADSAAFREYGVTGMTGPELARLARSFAGAWPYLELIAGHAGIDDPLDRRVVEAYWVGNRLLERTADAVDGGVAHHSFHVLCGYPWAGMLTDERKADRALAVLDQCRIRWGRVTSFHGDEVLVTGSALVWDGRRLRLGGPAAQRATSVFGSADLAVGDWVSLHWQWICDRLSRRQVRALDAYTRRHLDMVNQRIGQNCPVPRTC